MPVAPQFWGQRTLDACEPARRGAHFPSRGPGDFCVARYAQIALAKDTWSLDTASMKFATPLPIDAVLDELRATMTAHASAVLVAPPGAWIRPHASHSP